MLNFCDTAHLTNKLILTVHAHMHTYTHTHTHTHTHTPVGLHHEV